MVTGGYHIYPEQAAAGLWTTPADLCRIAAALMPGGRLSNLADVMLEPQPGLFSGVNRMGIGWLLSPADEPRAFSHNGANAGFRALLVALPDTGQGIAIMWNGETRDPVARDFLKAIVAQRRWPDRALHAMLNPPSAAAPAR